MKHVFNANDIPWEKQKVGKIKHLLGHELGHSSSIRVMSLATDEEFKTHEHTFVQIMYFTKGSGIVSVDEQSYQINSGLTVIVQPNQCHAVLNTGKDDIEIMIFEIYDIPSDENPFVDF